METTLEILPHTKGRSLITLLINLSPDEMDALKKSGNASYTDSSLPFPCQMYASPDPSIKTIQGLPIVDGSPQRGYLLKNARSVLLNRPIPGRTLLRVLTPSTIELGYVSPMEVQRICTWWKTTSKEIAQSLQRNLYHHSEIATFAPEEKKDIVHQKTLNPINPLETKGSRKRGLDDF